MKRPLILLAALVVVATNLAAFGLGAWNRASVETDIVLTERELRLAREPGLADEVSMTSLRLTWMQARPDSLGGEMVSRAGFHTGVAPSDPGAEAYYSRQLQRRVFVTLELDGPAWAAYREKLLRERHDANLTAAQHQERARSLAATIAGHPRLFAVDVDMDAQRLRSRHPDRRRYLVTQARAGVRLAGSGTDRAPVVSVSAIEPAFLNVPRPFSLTLNALAPKSGAASPMDREAPPRYEVHLRYGRFHEPWIVSVRALGHPPRE